MSDCNHSAKNKSTGRCRTCYALEYKSKNPNKPYWNKSNTKARKNKTPNASKNILTKDRERYYKNRENRIAANKAWSQTTFGRYCVFKGNAFRRGYENNC